MLITKGEAKAEKKEKRKRIINIYYEMVQLMTSSETPGWRHSAHFNLFVRFPLKNFDGIFVKKSKKEKRKEKLFKNILLYLSIIMVLGKGSLHRLLKRR